VAFVNQFGMQSSINSKKWHSNQGDRMIAGPENATLFIADPLFSYPEAEAAQSSFTSPSWKVW
jgi:hypothetical protein